ncbi:MAG: trigger factor [Candidatus Euphemobacter frigidus]|nr:trigger factor [Candidatus Euphemobacter frigidus]MDP8274910.1 trigger factor [Candidatus Euphemobacter frigidus]
MTKVDVQEIHPCRRELKIEVSPEAMESEIASTYNRLGRGRKIPGFRPGKAPRSVLEKYIGGEVRSQSISKQVQAGYLQAVKDRDLDVVGDPDFSDIDWTEGGSLRFTATVDISPEIQLKNYRGIRLTREGSQVVDEEIDRTVESLRERLATYETGEERPLREGDWALVDYRPSGAPDDQWVEGRLIEINSPESDALGPQLAGMRPGETRSVKVANPQPGESGSDLLEFEARLQEVKKKNLPEITDEWARSWGNFPGIAELREQIKEDIRQRKELSAKRAMEAQAIDFLLKKHTFLVPPRTLDSLTEQYLRAASPPGAKDTGEEELKRKARERAEADLRLIFMLAEIARREKIEVDPRAVAEEIAVMARQKGVSPEEYRKELEKNRQVDAVRDRILRQRTIDFLIEHAKIKETGAIK